MNLIECLFAFSAGCSIMPIVDAFLNWQNQRKSTEIERLEERLRKLKDVRK